jgi:hypothetical protein
VRSPGFGPGAAFLLVPYKPSIVYGLMAEGRDGLRKRFLTGAPISGTVSHPRPGQRDHRGPGCASLTQTLLGFENGIRCRLLGSQRPAAFTGAPARAGLRVDLGIELSLDTVNLDRARTRRARTGEPGHEHGPRDHRNGVDGAPSTGPPSKRPYSARTLMNIRVSSWSCDTAPRLSQRPLKFYAQSASRRTALPHGAGRLNLGCIRAHAPVR